MEINHAPPITEFDKITTNHSTLMIKALIPFLEPQMQKSLSIMIRFQELQQTLTYFSSPFHQMSCSASPDAMMDAIMPYCPPNIKDLINTIKNVMQMSNAFKMYSDMEQNPAFQEIFNQMNKSFYNDEPQFNDFSFNEESFNDDNFNNETSFNSDDFNNDNFDNASKDGASPPPDSVKDNSFSSTDKILNDFMNNEQKNKYEEFMKQLEDMTF